MEPLRIEKLTKVYGSLRAVNEVSFSIYPGEVFGLLGPNGAGKTSIISIITTLEMPTGGTAKVFGLDVTLRPKEAKEMAGSVPQEIVNHGFFTVEEILRFHSGYYGLLFNQKRIDYLLSKLGLSHYRNAKIKELSGGFKRRLMIAKALVHSPKLLLLDEPTAGVDVELRAILWNFIRELKEEGVSVLLTTHYLEEAEALCDRVLFLDHGSVKKMGKTDELIRELTEREVVITLKAPLPPLSHPHLVLQNEYELVFRFGSSKSIGELIATLPLELREVQDLVIREGKLEDAFLRIVGSNYE